jgi:hypothetical protein
VRILAVRFLARRPETEAKTAVLGAIEDPVPEVQTAALAALSPLQATDAIRVVTELLGGDTDWPVRVRAAATLGRLGRGSADPRAIAALSAVATTDSFALVRDAAVQALFQVDEARARGVLSEIAANDPEPRVRQRARTLLDRR